MYFVVWRATLSLIKRLGPVLCTNAGGWVGGCCCRVGGGGGGGGGGSATLCRNASKRMASPVMFKKKTMAWPVMFFQEEKLLGLGGWVWFCIVGVACLPPIGLVVSGGSVKKARAHFTLDAFVVRKKMTI